jgi:hypothetical protein
LHELVINIIERRIREKAIVFFCIGFSIIPSKMLKKIQNSSKSFADNILPHLPAQKPYSADAL